MRTLAEQTLISTFEVNYFSPKKMKLFVQFGNMNTFPIKPNAKPKKGEANTIHAGEIFLMGQCPLNLADAVFHSKFLVM
jgi:hypothetical protein